MVVGEFSSRNQSGAVLGNFLLVADGSLATEETRLFLTYDREFLYIRGNVGSFALNPASNQRDSFKAKATERDGPVAADDSVEFRFESGAPGESSRIFYIAINSLGTVQDMKMSANGWDRSWNANLQSAGRIVDGQWQFEMAVPLAELSLEPDNTKRIFRLNAIRFDRHRNETASWVYLSSTNFDAPDALGSALFNAGPTVSEVPQGSLPVSPGGKVKLGLSSMKEAEPTWWVSELIQGREVVATSSGEVPAGESQVQIPVPRTGKIEKPIDKARWRFSLVVGENTVYQSALYPYRNEGDTLAFGADSSAPFALYLNGEKIASEEASIRDLALPLQVGANVIAMELPAGAVISPHLRTQAGWEIADSSGWKVCAAGDPESLTSAVNDASWALATTEPDGKGVLAAVPDKLAERVLLRKTVLLRYTQLLKRSAWNTWQLSGNDTYVFRWEGSQPKQKGIPFPMEAFRLSIDLPEGMELVGASGITRTMLDGKPLGVYNTARDILYQWKPVEKVDRDGLSYQRYIIERDLPVAPPNSNESWLEGQYRSKEMVVLGVRATEGIQPSGPAYVWAEAQSGSIVELPQAYLIRVHPKLDGERPKKIVLSLYARDGYLKDETLANAYFDTVAAAGINEVMGESSHAHLRQIGVRQTFFFNFTQAAHYGANSTQLLGDALYEAEPKARSIGFDGKPGKTACLVYLARNESPWKHVTKEIQRVKASNPSLTQFFWDYEFSPFPGHLPIYQCFSEFGISTFAKEHGLPEGLTPQLIRKNHAKEWIDFTAQALADVAGRLRAISHENGLGFVMYSGYAVPYTLERYNIDWSRLAGRIDRAYCGYTQDKAVIDATHRALGETPLVGALLSMGETIQSHTPAQIVRKLLQHPQGVLFWYESGFDALTLSSIASVSKFASRYEEIILNGKQEAPLFQGDGIPPHDVLKSGDQYLVVFLNERSTSPMDIKIPLPEGFEVVAETQEGMNSPVAPELHFHIPSGMFQAVLLTKKSPR